MSSLIIGGLLGCQIYVGLMTDIKQVEKNCLIWTQNIIEVKVK